MPPRESGPGEFPDDGGFPPMGRGFGDGADASTEEIRLDAIDEDDGSGLYYDSSGLPIGPNQPLPIEEEPSALVARYLFPTEKFRGEWRKHWSYLFDQFAYAAAATFVFGWLWGFLVKRHAGLATSVVIAIWLLVMSVIAWRVADWYYDRFILTNKRIMAVSGMVTRTVAMMPLLRVTDMKYQQSALGRVLGYGTFVVESAGQDQALREVKHLPSPNELYLRIVEEMYEPEAVEAKLAARTADIDAGVGSVGDGASGDGS